MKTGYVIFIALAIVMGIIIPYQSQINARLGSSLGNPLLGTFVNFVVGVLMISMIVILNKVQLPSFQALRNVHPFYLIGGVMGVMFVTGSLFLVPRIGAINLFSCLIAGQIISSIIMDYFGLFSEASKLISRDKWIGLVLLVAGIIMIIKEK